VSIHADDEFNLKLALISELDDVVPRDELAGFVIARHRREAVERLRRVEFEDVDVPVLQRVHDAGQRVQRSASGCLILLTPPSRLGASRGSIRAQREANSRR